MSISAEITLNGSPGSDDDMPINTAVLLGNNDDTGVVSWLWTLVAQPDGAVDSLSSTTIAAPQLVPRKEGTYLLHLRVTDISGNTEDDQVALGIRLLKTRERIPAQGETTEVSTSEGWHPALATQLYGLDRVRADPGLLVGVIGDNGMSAGMVCYVWTTNTIKSGLPGEEVVPSFKPAQATTFAPVSGLLAVLIAAVDGGGTTLGKLAYFRWQGLHANHAGAPAAGDPVYVSDAALLSTTAGTVARQVGTVGRAGGGTYDVVLHGGAAGGTELAGAGLLVSGTVPPPLQPGGIDVGNMSAGLALGVEDTDDAAATIALDLKHKLDGGAPGAAGVGVSQLFHAPNDAGTLLRTVGLTAILTDPAAASEKGALVIIVRGGGAFAERARFDHAGRLLIGATAPIASEKLRVVGDGYLSGDLYLPTAPTTATHAANKGYVDGAIARELLWGVADTNGQANPASFIPPGFSASASLTEIKWTACAAGQLTVIRARARVGPTSAGADPVETFTVRKNGADTSLVVTLNAAQTSNLDNSPLHTVTVAAGDDLSIGYAATAGITTGALDLMLSVLFRPL